jgi:hypothetical protein
MLSSALNLWSHATCCLLLPISIRFASTIMEDDLQTSNDPGSLVAVRRLTAYESCFHPRILVRDLFKHVFEIYAKRRSDRHPPFPSPGRMSIFLGICPAPSTRNFVSTMPHCGPFPIPCLVDALISIVFAVAGLCGQSEIRPQESGLVGRDQEDEAGPPGDARRRERGNQAHTATILSSSSHRSLMETEHARSLANGFASGWSTLKHRVSYLGGAITSWPST